VAARISNPLPNEGNSAAFREFGWRFTNIVARALFAMGQWPSYSFSHRCTANMDPLFLDYCRQWPARVEPAWEQDVADRVAQMSERDIPNSMKGRAKEVVALIQFIREKGLSDGVVDGLISAINYDRTYFDKITASLLPLMEKLISGRIGELISPDYEGMADTRPIFEWLDVIKRKGIVYVGLDALSDFTVSAPPSATRCSPTWWPSPGIFTSTASMRASPRPCATATSRRFRSTPTR
jgi:hypothetical protein